MKHKIKPVYKFEKISHFEIDEYETAFSTSNQGILKWDLIDNKIYFSEECLKMLGYDDGNCIDIINFVNKNYSKAFLDILNNCLSHNKKQFDCEYKVLRYDKTYIWVHCYCKIFYNSNNMPVKLISCLINITDKKQWKNKLYNIAYYDNLTNLPNANMLKKDLKILCKQKNKFFVAFMDINNFKVINDTLGHDIGDIFLNKLSKILKKFQNKNCKFYRYSGDEFVFIIKSILHKNQLEMFMNNLYNVLTNYTFTIKNIPLCIDTTFVSSSSGQFIF